MAKTHLYLSPIQARAVYCYHKSIGVLFGARINYLKKQCCILNVWLHILGEAITYSLFVYSCRSAQQPIHDACMAVPSDQQKTLQAVYIHPLNVYNHTLISMHVHSIHRPLLNKLKPKIHRQHSGSIAT